eukprot:TRINITY_DN43369_c0_g1_i1.p1 TRINITY_DN43369_c0_g1~~TRINITY_DN43369_c0_g1_i1.p1  ORF type:complete len:232 (+),score=40.94 TRINITY_DN43369_c0_g1_i1:79-774(+)
MEERSEVSARIEQELLRTQNCEWVQVIPSANDRFVWTAKLHGPPGTPYVGGVFHIFVRFTKEYPKRPPQMRFETKIFHCNFSEQGHIDFSALLAFGYSPSMSVLELLQEVYELLDDPDPGNPVRHEVAELYREEPDQHNTIAAAWTRKYAMNSSSSAPVASASDTDAPASASPGVEEEGDISVTERADGAFLPVNPFPQNPVIRVPQLVADPISSRARQQESMDSSPSASS